MLNRQNYFSAEQISKINRELKVTRAVEAFRMFYPCVSVWSFFKDNMAIGMIPNQRHGICLTDPQQNALTANSDTPYGILLIDTTQDPIVIDVPAGNTMGV
ncbi:hypothetical protein MsAg5_09920 [Methanosarcinaceae archaeon Ag5]|uniref:DUF1254 domain-containing protein n=1 Tax=Methanolapillus africanus TaxID=3028297 RepID=A0AAE4MK49_9EURY|nr:hypothetical protein [Methanosarcinaceae archaeon Ag5]